MGRRCIVYQDDETWLCNSFPPGNGSKLSNFLLGAIAIYEISV